MCFELAPKRMQAVSLTNCCWWTVPYNWAGHREGCIAQSHSFPRNSVVAAGHRSRRAEMSPCRITVTRLHRIVELVWAAACVDCERHQCQLKLDSVHDGQPV